MVSNFKKSSSILIFSLMICQTNVQAQTKKQRTYKKAKTEAIKIKKQIIATQKALKFLSENIKLGYNSVDNLKEFESTKNLIFKK